jgi:hypothetical protein
MLLSVPDGPVLSQTDLYLLKTELEINPIFAQKFGGYHLVLDLTSGETRLVALVIMVLTDDVNVIKESREMLTEGIQSSRRKCSRLFCRG